MQTLMLVLFIIQLAVIGAVCFLFVRQAKFEKAVRTFAKELGAKGSFICKLQTVAVVIFAFLALRKNGGDNA